MPRLPRMIFGLGTPRSGTWSIYRLMEAQPDTYSIHENSHLPYEPDGWGVWGTTYRFYGEALASDNNIKQVFSVAFFWMSYVAQLAEHLPDSKFICLQRDKQKAVQSMWDHFIPYNHWTYRDSQHWDKQYRSGGGPVARDAFPKYDLPRLDAIKQYYDDYYWAANYWQDIMPSRFKIFPLESLNTEDGVRSVMDFAEIENPVIHVGVGLNVKGNLRGEIDVQT